MPKSPDPPQYHSSQAQCHLVLCHLQPPVFFLDNNAMMDRLSARFAAELKFKSQRLIDHLQPLQNK
eukprot:218600-Ditylum_brightwellii.AAC.1